MKKNDDVIVCAMIRARRIVLLIRILRWMDLVIFRKIGEVVAFAYAIELGYTCNKSLTKL